jgi:hypothetical protein
MKKLRQFAAAVAASVSLIAGMSLMAADVEARECFKKAGQGTAGTIEGAKFQVDEVLLQATDWGAWAEWMATGTTSGYDFGPRKYKCKQGGLGYECYGTSTICKK